MMMNRKVLMVGFILSALVTAAAVVIILRPQVSAAADEFNGVIPVDPPRALSDFTLISQTGEPLSLSDLRGKQVLLLFGYTHCPDVCPLTLMDFERIRESLGPAAEELAFVLVSVDGERDTPERLATYLEQRDVDDFVIGLTGAERDLRRLSPGFNLFFQKQYSAGENSYLVDHTASTFLIDAEGQLTTIFAFGTEPEVISAFIAGV